MAYKQFQLEELGTIKIYKRRASRSIRLSVMHNGDVRVTMPNWVPYKAGLAFAKTRLDWIAEHRGVQRPALTEGQTIGKAHHLHFVASDTHNAPISRLVQNQIVVSYPANLDIDDPAVQSCAAKAGIRALRAQAEALLPQRLHDIAASYGFVYKSVKIKQLKRRWGSCDQDTNIVLNLYLMQLPWECIDYVLLHELTHIKHMHHGKEFWDAMQAMNPQVRQLRKTMRAYQPHLFAQT